MEATAMEYAFETLVAGEENVLAISGAMKVIAEPGEKYNPLFLFGPPSVGKTHLLFALKKKFEEENKEWKIAAYKAGEFIETCASAWQRDAAAEFRQKLWQQDALFLDDIHLFAKRPEPLEELYHAFNRLVADGRQIVVTSRYAPVELEDFSLALRSRLQSGLVLSLDIPRDRLMRDIIEQKCQLSGLRPTRKAARFLCNEVRTVRDLDGILNRLGEGNNGKARKISLAELKEIFEQHPDCVLTIADIARAVCQYFQSDLAKVRSAGRQQSLVQARQMAMYLARELTSAPLTEIGGYFGGRDHTTVLHACRKVAEELRTSPYTARWAREIRILLRG